MHHYTLTGCQERAALAPSSSSGKFFPSLVHVSLMMAVVTPLSPPCRIVCDGTCGPEPGCNFLLRFEALFDQHHIWTNQPKIFCWACLVLFEIVLCRWNCLGVCCGNGILCCFEVFRLSFARHFDVASVFPLFQEREEERCKKKKGVRAWQRNPDAAKPAPRSDWNS